MSSCCNTDNQQPSCHSSKNSVDYLLWGSLLGVVVLYVLYWLLPSVAQLSEILHVLAHSVFELMNIIWWGIALGIIMIAILSKVPREFVVAILGTGTGLRGIVRATIGGVLLDLCNHGILMVGAKLYERGASTGQVIAFLVASPWNSFSLTLILIALVGFKWTLLFILASMLIAIITGWFYELFTHRGVLPNNPHQIDLPDNFRFWPQAKKSFSATNFNPEYFISMFKQGISESRMVMRWILVGVLLASLIRALMDTSDFQHYFGPTLAGLSLTLVAATIIEVCSEGSTPVAADLLTRAKAPGNGFAFLMGGVSTDYTEIMVLKDTTKSWKVALFLPLITLPQIFFIAWLANMQAI